MDNILDRMNFLQKIKEYEDSEEPPVKLGVLIAEAQYETGNEIAEMKEHLEKVNGTVAEIQREQLEIKFNQSILLTRLWNCLPNWGQKSVIIWLCASFLVVPVLSSLTAVLSILLTR